MTVLSPDADATSLPSGENATELTESEWPSSVCSAAPVTASQSLIVSSNDADATTLPSGENATDLTQPEWPSSVCSAAPVIASQILIVPSTDADATPLPSGENAADLTPPEWPSSVCSVAFHFACTVGFLQIQVGILFSNCFRTTLSTGVKIRAEQYVWRGANSIIDRLNSTNRFASWTKLWRFGLFSALGYLLVGFPYVMLGGLQKYKTLRTLLQEHPLKSSPLS